MPAKNPKSSSRMSRIAPVIPWALSSKRPKKEAQQPVASPPAQLPQVEPPESPQRLSALAQLEHVPPTFAASPDVVTAQGINGSSDSANLDNAVDEQALADSAFVGQDLLDARLQHVEIVTSEDLSTSSSAPAPAEIAPIHALESSRSTPSLPASLPVKVEELALIPLIRELPPPFFPARHPSNPAAVPAAPEVSSRQDSEASQSAMHQLHHSSGNIVFGGYRDSATSSPVPPQNPYYSYAKPPTGLGNQNAVSPPLFHNGQVYPHSEMSNAFMYPPPAFHHYGNTYGAPREFYGQTISHYHAPRPFFNNTMRYPYPVRRPEELQFQPRLPPPPPNAYSPYPAPSSRAPFVATEPTKEVHAGFDRDAGSLVNGVARSQSLDQGLSRENRESQSNLESTHQPPDMSSSNRLKSNHFSSPDGTVAHLADYVISQLGKRDFADYILELSHAGHLFHFLSLPAHGLLLARSPKIRSLMAMQHVSLAHPVTYPKVLNVLVSDKFMKSSSVFVEAVARLYGAPLINAVSLERLTYPESEQDLSRPLATLKMRTILSYAAAGHFLQLEDVISCAVDIAADNMDWGNINQALAFALEGGVGLASSQVENAGENGSSTSSQEEMNGKLDYTAATPVYGNYSDRLLTHTLKFIVANIPVSFQLLPTVSQSPDFPRLPSIADPKDRRSDSRLSHIRFGAMTLEQDSSPGQDTVSISSVLISLPFSLLKHILEHHGLRQRLGWVAVSDMAKSVIGEREARRQRVVDMSDDPVDERLWNNVCWTEAVEAQSPSGLKILRRFLDIQTPTSSRSTNKSRETTRTTITSPLS